MSNDFIKLAYNDVMTGTLNKKALETYCAFVTKKYSPKGSAPLFLTWMISNRTTITIPI